MSNQELHLETLKKFDKLITSTIPSVKDSLAELGVLTTLASPSDNSIGPLETLYTQNAMLTADIAQLNQDIKTIVTSVYNAEQWKLELTNTLTQVDITLGWNQDYEDLKIVARSHGIYC